ncbi:MAG: chemotaxis protein CheA [Leptospirales bacterium]|nr:chemotaxis protein CheA [Leptospirales bacterium]
MSRLAEGDDIYLEFITESQEMLSLAESSTLRLETDTDAATVNELFRFVHTVKGNVGYFQNQRLTSVAHELETLLGDVRSGKESVTGEIIDVILIAIDWIRRALANPRVESTEDPDLLDRIAMARSKPKTATADRAHPAVFKASGARAIEPLKIPAKLVRRATDLQKQLVLADVPLSGPNSISPFELEERCARARVAGELAYCKVRPDLIPDLQSLNGDHLIAALVFGSNEPAATLEKYGIPAVRLRPIKTRSPGDAENSRMAHSDQPLEAKAMAPAENTENVSGEQDSAPLVAEHLRVPLSLLDRMIDLAGQTVGVRNELIQKLSASQDTGLQLIGSRLSQMITRLQEEIMRTRLQDLSQLFKRIPRVVRDTCRLTGKDVRVSFEGEQVELDKTLIDTIAESILHMVKNAIDHGIETPEERKLKGKDPQGHLSIKAVVQNRLVQVILSDDGQGLNYDALKATALSRGLISEEQAAAMSDTDAAELLFLPGLSTAKAITQTSGRGVGMDVVRASFKRAGGSITVHAERGRGTTFIGTLPQTLSIVTCLVVQVGSARFAIPRASILELVLVNPAHLSLAAGQRIYQLRDRILPLVDLRDLFYREPVSESEPCFIAVVQADSRRFGLMVQAVGNPEEILVRPLSIHFEGNPFYSGAAVLGDSNVVTILDVAGVARSVHLHAELEEATAQAPATRQKLESFLVFDAGEIRLAVSTNYSPRIETFHFGLYEAVMGGEVFRFQNKALPLIHPDRVFGEAGQRALQPAFVIIVSSGETSIALAATAIIAIHDHLPDQHSDSFNHPAIESRAIVGDRTVLSVNVPVLLQQLDRNAFRVEA